MVWQSLKFVDLEGTVSAWQLRSLHKHLLPNGSMCSYTNTLSGSAHSFSRGGSLRSMRWHSVGLSLGLHAESGVLSVNVTCRLQGMWSCLLLLRGMNGRGMMHSGLLWGRAPFACTSTSATSCSTSDVQFRTCITAQAGVRPSLALHPLIGVPTAATGAPLWARHTCT